MNEVILEHVLSSGQKIQILRGDITEENVDAIVNAANRHLQHGGGVAGAISQKGGASIQQESDVWIQEHGAVSHSEPAYTSAGSLPCRFIIHAVGPVWGEGDEDAKLSKTVVGALELADRLKLASLSLPAISTGIYQFPKDRAARIILQSILSFFQDNPEGNLAVVRLTLYDQETIEAFLDAWDELDLGSKRPSDE
jgi:O-acetyl-ADP-ribose deacetylase